MGWLSSQGWADELGDKSHDGQSKNPDFDNATSVRLGGYSISQQAQLAARSSQGAFQGCSGLFRAVQGRPGTDWSMADPRTATGGSDGARAPQSGRRYRQRLTGDGRRAEEEPQINSAEGRGSTGPRAADRAGMGGGPGGFTGSGVSVTGGWWRSPGLSFTFAVCSSQRILCLLTTSAWALARLRLRARVLCVRCVCAGQRTGGGLCVWGTRHQPRPTVRIRRSTTSAQHGRWHHTTRTGPEAGEPRERRDVAGAEVANGLAISRRLPGRRG